MSSSDGTRVLVFTNRKGGCGKTTSTVNIAAAMSHMGKRVLLVDMDPQAHATMSLGIGERTSGHDAFTLITGASTFEDTLTPTYSRRLTAIPGSRRLQAYERTYATRKEYRTRLRSKLQPAIGAYDMVCIDTPPTTGLLTISSLVAGTDVYIPMQAHFLAMEGMLEIVRIVERVKKQLNPDLEIRGILPTFFNSREQMSQDIMRELRDTLGGEVFLPPVRTAIELAEAPGHGFSIFQHDRRSKGALDYYKVAQRIIAQGEDRQPDGGA